MSSNSRRKGSVTSIGLLASPSKKNSNSKPYQARNLVSTYRTYAHSVSSANKVLRTSLRSATHATDSTCRGCTPKSPATTALFRVSSRHAAEECQTARAYSADESGRWSRGVREESHHAARHPSCGTATSPDASCRRGSQTSPRRSRSRSTPERTCGLSSM